MVNPGDSDNPSEGGHEKKAHSEPEGSHAEHKAERKRKPDYAKHAIRIAVTIAVIALLFIAWNRIFSGAARPAALATVNGEQITDAQLDKAYEFFFFARGYPPEFKSMISKESFLNNSVIPEVLLLQEAKKAGIAVSESDVNGIIASLVNQSRMSLAELEAQMKASGFDMASFRDFYGKQLTIATLLNRTIISGIRVTEEGIRAYYERNKAAFAEPEQLRASHILVNTSEEAQTILFELKSGAKFSELAQKYSLDVSAVGGDLGFFSRGMMVPEFEEAAFKLGIGETSGLVKTGFGYHIIRVTNKTPERQLSIEEAREDIRSALVIEEQSRSISALIAELRSKADIRWNAAAIKVAEPAAAEPRVQETKPEPSAPEQAVSPEPVKKPCIDRHGLTRDTTILYYADWCASCKPLIASAKELPYKFSFVEEKNDAVVKECFGDVIKQGFPQLICAGSRAVKKTVSATDVEPFAKACLAQ